MQSDQENTDTESETESKILPIDDIEKEKNAYYKTLIAEAKTRAFKKFINKMEEEFIIHQYTKAFEEDDPSELPPAIYKRFSEVMTLKLKQQKKTPGSEFYFVTINPRESVTFEQFQTKIDKYIKSKMHLGCTYVYHQRGKTEDTLGTGFHVHMITMNNGTPHGSFVQRTKNMLKTICDVNNMHCLNIKNAGVLNNRIVYMRDDNDDEKRRLNKQWRSLHGIEDLYESKHISNHLIEDSSE